MEVRQIDPFDEAAFDRWFDVFHLTDRERWPASLGWHRQELLAMLRNTEGPEEHRHFVALDDDDQVVGVLDLEFFRRENLHLARADIRVPRRQQRRGVGTALLDVAAREARAAGRSELGGMDEVPLEADTAATRGFAEHHGFAPALLMQRRRVLLPLASGTRASLLASPQAQPQGFTLFGFIDRWPDEWMHDRCELGRRMSTDVPVGEQELDEENWDEARVRSIEAALDAQNRTKVTAVARHDESGRLVAFSEVAIPRGAPEDSWQHDTLVMREFRGHGLGLAVKLYNLEVLQAQYPQVQTVSTWNAAENEHIIAINEALGFELISNSTYWLKKLER